jgi:hypothetical protein
MKSKMLVGTVTAFYLMTSGAQAQVIPGRWELADALTPGTPIVLILKAETRIECFFKSSSPSNIAFIDDQGIERIVPKAEVEVIETAENLRDGLSNGTLIGALVGAGAGFAYEASYWDWDESGALAIPFVAAIIGAAVGAGVDGLAKRPKLLYIAP